MKICVKELKRELILGEKILILVEGKNEVLGTFKKSLGKDFILVDIDGKTVKHLARFAFVES